MKEMVTFLKDEDGQGMVEYGLIIGLVALAVIGALTLLGPKIANMFTNAGNEIENASAVK